MRAGRHRRFAAAGAPHVRRIRRTLSRDAALVGFVFFGLGLARFDVAHEYLGADVHLVGACFHRWPRRDDDQRRAWRVRRDRTRGVLLEQLI
jgi:hypothetical protein